MTLREKIGQLFMLGFSGTSVSKELAGLLEEYRPGGLILFSRNLQSPEQIARLTNTLQQKAARAGRMASHAPLLISVDQEGGRVSRVPAGFTVFPACAVLGRCDSTELAYSAAAATAAELRAVGINMNLAPVLDLDTNPENPIIGDRSFSPDPTRVCELGLATIAGLQDHKVIACGKHFPGHGDTAVDSHKELPVVAASLDRLRDLELRPFRHAIQNGLAAMMTAHVLYPALDEALPATLSPAILTGLLRDELGFTGLTLTDDLEMHAIIDHYGIGEAAVRAVQAGADLLLICKNPGRQVTAMDAVQDAVRHGAIPEERLEASLHRIAQTKQRFLRPYAPVDPRAVKQIVGSQEHKALVERIALTSERRLKASV
ncbi:MAG: beta-N-acetylhexosaminidase [Nitrospiraceae bacterium]